MGTDAIARRAKKAKFRLLLLNIWLVLVVLTLIFATPVFGLVGGVVARLGRKIGIEEQDGFYMFMSFVNILGFITLLCVVCALVLAIIHVVGYVRRRSAEDVLALSLGALIAFVAGIALIGLMVVMDEVSPMIPYLPFVCFGTGIVLLSMQNKKYLKPAGVCLGCFYPMIDPASKKCPECGREV